MAKKAYNNNHNKVRCQHFTEDDGGSTYILASSFSPVEPAMLRPFFDDAFLREQGLIDAGTQRSMQSLGTGRAQVTPFSALEKRFVLRHYRRGGMVRHLNKQSYLWRGLENSRAYQELVLLDELATQGLPVCRPLAARICRCKAAYTASLITFELENCEPFSSLLKEQRTTTANWQQAGRAIRKVHDCGVFHADLNAHNLLVSAEQVFLIDFDRAAVRRDDQSWKEANLQRLQRSLNKVVNKFGVSYDEQGWQALLAAYDDGG